MTSPAPSRLSDAQAASWDARLRSPDCTPEERERFAGWLKADLRNQESFDRLQAGLSALRQAADHPQLRALRESARLVEYGAARRRMLARAAMAAGLATLVAGTSFLALRRHDSVGGASSSFVESTAQTPAAPVNSWNTGADERRTVALADGSSVTLNASTRLEAEWLTGERRIHLLAGQAFFRVAKDPSRPFVVTAGERTVTALGTMFDVRLGPDALQVTLVEGRVSVKPVQASKDPPVELAPSQQFEAFAGKAQSIHPVDALAESAWANAQVIFTDEPLPAAVAKMNQYSKRQVIAGPQLAKFRVNGMFLATNQDGFVAAVTSYYPIVARQDPSGRLFLELVTDNPQR